MYFDSKIKGHRGLPWLDSRTAWEKSSDKYFEALEELVEEIDSIEASTPFITDLSPDDFSNGYKFVLARLKELKSFLKSEDSISNEGYIDSLNDIYDNLMDLSSDSDLYDDVWDDDDEEEYYEEDDDDDDIWDDDAEEDDDEIF